MAYYYPSFEDSTFEERIYRKKEYYLNKQPYIDKEVKESLENYCETHVGDFQLLSHQKLLRNYINPLTPYKNILVFHGTGTGKSCTAIAIAESFRSHIKKIRETTNLEPFIYILSSNTARNSFIKELFGKCPDQRYVTDEERLRLDALSKLTTPEGKLEFENFLKKLMSRIEDPQQGGYYKFMGYQSFQNRTIGARSRTDTKELIKTEQGDIQRKFGRDIINNLDESILIVDEVHNIEANDWGLAIEVMIQRSKNLRVILLTATPMQHQPSEIVQILNMLLPLNKKIKTNDIFANQKLTPNGLKIIAERSKGVVSFVRGVNPYTFPERIEMGKILPGFKYLKLVQCPMSPLHYNTYQKEFKDINESKHLVDMVFPNPNNSNIGIFKNEDIDTILKNAPSEWLKKHGMQISFDPQNKKQVIITGPILEAKNLKKYSYKYYKVLENLNNSLIPTSGPVFVYNEWVVGIGLLLFQQILIWNGYEIYDENRSIEYNATHYYPKTKCVFCGHTQKSSHKGHKFFPAKIILLAGDIEPSRRNKLVSIINNFQNKDGRIIKVILGSKVVRESVDFKRVREVHILNFQYNVPLIEQIVGRAVRHCSHVGLPKDERNVKIFKYTSSIPGSKDHVNVFKDHVNVFKDLSVEEEKYLEIENTHITMKKIERTLKINAMDCALNKFENVFEQEIKETKDCNQKGKKPCTAICDYQPCGYHCSWEPKTISGSQLLKKFKQYTLKELDTSTYDIGFYQNEVNKIKEQIKTLFLTNMVFIFDEIKKYISLPLLQDRFIYVALNEMIQDKEIFINEFGFLGYLIYKGKYYIFQPLNNPNEAMHFTQRFLPTRDLQPRNVDIQDFIDSQTKEVPKLTRETILERLADTDDPIRIAKILSRLEIKQQQKLLEDAISNIALTRLGKENLLPNVYYKIVDNYQPYLFTNSNLEQSGFFSSETLSSKSIDIDNLIVGHLFGKKPRCWSEEGWSNCIKDVSKKFQQVKENPIIVGFIDKDGRNNLIFKLRKPHKATIDRRKISRGFVCSQSGDKKEIIRIARLLNIKNTKGSIQDTCTIIEEELRRREQKDKGKLKWFMEYFEVLSET